MKTFNIKDMTKGWFVGNITPVAFSTKDCEVAFKQYKKGDKDVLHFHKVATEITLVASGKISINGDIYEQGEIIVIAPYEVSKFEAIEDSTTVVVKLPGANNDKFEVIIPQG